MLSEFSTLTRFQIGMDLFSLVLFIQLLVSLQKFFLNILYFFFFFYIAFG